MDVLQLELTLKKMSNTSKTNMSQLSNCTFEKSVVSSVQEILVQTSKGHADTDANPDRTGPK